MRGVPLLAAGLGLIATNGGVAAAETPLDSGQNLTGTLDGQAMSLPDGTRFQCYLIETKSKQNVQITMHSPDFESKIWVTRGRGCRPSSVVYTSKTGAQNSVEVRFTSPGGFYSIIARGTEATASGSFRISFDAAAPTAQAEQQVAMFDPRVALMNRQAQSQRDRIREAAEREAERQRQEREMEEQRRLAQEQQQAEEDAAQAAAFQNLIGSMQQLASDTATQAQQQADFQTQLNAQIQATAAQAQAQKAASEQRVAQQRAQNAAARERLAATLAQNAQNKRAAQLQQQQAAQLAALRQQEAAKAAQAQQQAQAAQQKAMEQQQLAAGAAQRQRAAQQMRQQLAMNAAPVNGTTTTSTTTQTVDKARRTSNDGPGSPPGPGWTQWEHEGSIEGIDFYYSYLVNTDVIMLKWKCVNNTDNHQTCSIVGPGGGSQNKKYRCYNGSVLVGTGGWLGEAIDVAAHGSSSPPSDDICQNMHADRVVPDVSLDYFR